MLSPVAELSLELGGLCSSPTVPVPQVWWLFESLGCTVHPIYVLWRMEVWVQERKGSGSLYRGVSMLREVGGR